MPEGDALHRAARSLQPLVGERLEVVTPHPRARVTRVAERLDGKRLLRVEAVGKNLLLRFEGGLVLRSHLRMSGRWQLLQRGDGARKGTPWLVLRGATNEAVLWNGPVLELDESHVRRLGPDILADPPDLDGMLVQAARSRPALRNRRSAPRPAPRRGHRQPLAGGGTLARTDLSLAEARGPLGGGAPLGVDRGRATDAPLARLGSQKAVGLPAGRAPLPALRRRRSSPEARATPTASPTGARSARPNPLKETARLRRSGTT